MGRKRLTAEERRLQILDIAAREFSKTGLEITRIKDIAEICGVNEALIYQHFPCKEDLYFAAMEYVQAEILGGWIAIFDRDTLGIDALREIELHRTHLIYENPHFATAVEYSALASPNDERMQKLNAKVFAAAQDYVEKLVRKGQEDGSIRSDLNPSSVAYWIRGYSHLVNLSIVIEINNAFSLEQAEEHLNNLIDVLRPVKAESATRKPAKSKPAPAKPVAKPKPKTKPKPVKSGKPAVKPKAKSRG